LVAVLGIPKFEGIWCRRNSDHSEIGGIRSWSIRSVIIGGDRVPGIGWN